MADKDWARGRGEASYLSNLKITTEFLDTDYDIVNENLTRGETRLLRVFSLIPRTAGRPTFHARVDDGGPDNAKEPKLDIDIKGVDAAVMKDFVAKRNGYSGHHTVKTPNPNERIFDIEIAIPSGKVFKGHAFFNVAFSVSASMKAESKMTVITETIRASSNDKSS